MDDMDIVGRPATELAAAVRAGELHPTKVVTAHLERIERLDPRFGAFVSVLRDQAVADAEELAARPDLGELPLAGVPVAIKDNVDVAGEPTPYGSPAVRADPAAEDDPVVAALRQAGAIVVGKTRIPELGIWPFTDGADAAALNPWDTTRVAGGSSGGSGAAVASAMVPLALGNDGLGSIRIPAAANGLFGMKPSSGLIPIRGLDGSDRFWFGMSQHGPLATTVGDAALMLDVMAGTDRYRHLPAPERPLRVAVSVASPSPTVRPHRDHVEAVLEAGRLMRAAGHHVVRADPPYRVRDALPIVARFTQAPADDLEHLDVDEERLERRTRTHVGIGRWVRRRRPVDPSDIDPVRERMTTFFADHDVLLTPVLSGPPPEAVAWHERSWFANFNTAFSWAVFPGLWNFVDFPAASIPLLRTGGLPVGVQIVAPSQREDRVLETARQIEQVVPWQRHAPVG